ncbi:MAG TPA: lysylphosphatidylglycerol synthase domain-containing protein [Solirubrobacteraceae bacterium]|nr:lysylphosphatidylglycerol synthase domain-containing protein [Solirubrobacteraceae bacterium]
MRIALVSPYSWTYPGGVTRHIEALAEELEAVGHETRVLAPFDPDDALARRMHRGARPQPMEMPARLVPLGRTAGFPANGAISNLAPTVDAVLALWRELATGGYDLVHVHEPVVPLVGRYAASCAGDIPIVGTFHSFSENAFTNGIGNALGARRHINRLHARIAVSEAAAWTAQRFFGGRYTIVPNGVHLRDAWDSLGGCRSPTACDGDSVFGDLYIEQSLHDQQISKKESHNPHSPQPLRVLFVGQAVERKGLPVLLRAFEALREHVPATLTLVGASAEEIAPLLLDDRGVSALGKVSEERKAAELARADVLCAPSLGGESFGMVLTEAFAAGTPVVASDIAGYRDVVRDGIDGVLTPRGDARALAEALRQLALAPQRRVEMARAARERAERFAWPHVAAEVLEVYEQARAVGRAPTRTRQLAVRSGLAPADLLPRVPAQRLPSPEPALAGATARGVLRVARRGALAAVSLAGLGLALTALQRIGLGRVAASLVASSPGLIAAGFGLMCLAMVVRGFAWHAILSAAPTWRKARRRDALQGTFIGVLMSATLPARLGEPSRALIVARRIGRARETLPIVLGTMVSQTLLNLLALMLLGVAMLCGAPLLHGHGGALLAPALVPLGALMLVLLAPVLLPHGAERSHGSRHADGLQALVSGMRRTLLLVREGLRIFAAPRQAALATGAQLAAWALQCASCWLLLVALGLDHRVGIAGAAAVLFAVNVTAAIPATPANVGVFQAACVAVLTGAYHVSTPDAIAYGIILQAVEVATAMLMGMPALVKEGLSWKEVRLRTMHAAPVQLPALPNGSEVASRA